MSFLRGDKMKGKRKEDMLNRINESSSIVLWGLSFLGERVNTYLKENDITVDFYWDINAENMFDREEKIYLPGDVAPKNALIIKKLLTFVTEGNAAFNVFGILFVKKRFGCHQKLPAEQVLHFLFPESIPQLLKYSSPH